MRQGSEELAPAPDDLAVVAPLTMKGLVSRSRIDLCRYLQTAVCRPLDSALRCYAYISPLLGLVSNMWPGSTLSSRLEYWGCAGVWFC